MTVKTVEYSTSVITTDDVEVIIKGIVSYRIDRPELIFSKINFNNREAGELKVMDIARKYCESVAEQIVGGLTYSHATAHGPKHISEMTESRITSTDSILGASSPYGISVDFFAVREVSLADGNLKKSILRKKSLELESLAALKALQLQKEEASARAEVENDALEQKHLMAHKEMNLERKKHSQQIEIRKLDKELDERVHPDKLREVFLTKTLPELGRAISSQIGRVNIMETSSDPNASASQWGYGLLNNIVAIADHYGFRATSLLKNGEEATGKANHNSRSVVGARTDNSSTPLHDDAAGGA